MNTKQRGFLSLTGYLALGAGAVILALGLALKLSWAAKERETEKRITVEAQFQAFKTQVKAAGEAQEAKNRETMKQQEKINAERYQALQDRYTAITARYARLRDKPADPGSGPMPPIPTAPIVTNDAASNQRLLDLLAIADRQTAQLIELQQWVASQHAIQ